MTRGISTLAVAAVFAVTGDVSPARATIVPGVGLARVKIGMTLTQTKKMLGRPQTVNARKQLAGHRGYIEYGWNYSSIWVGFVNTKGHLHAVLIGTSLANEKTKSGVGVGTPVQRVRALPQVQCFLGTAWVGRPYFDPDPHQGPYCLLGGRDGRRTIFALNCLGPGDTGCHKYTVRQVIVRSAF